MMFLTTDPFTLRREPAYMLVDRHPRHTQRYEDAPVALLAMMQQQRQREELERRERARQQQLRLQLQLQREREIQRQRELQRQRAVALQRERERQRAVQRALLAQRERARMQWLRENALLRASLFDDMFGVVQSLGVMERDRQCEKDNESETHDKQETQPQSETQSERSPVQIVVRTFDTQHGWNEQRFALRGDTLERVDDENKAAPEKEETQQSLTETARDTPVEPIVPQESTSQVGEQAPSAEIETHVPTNDEEAHADVDVTEVEDETCPALVPLFAEECSDEQENAEEEVSQEQDAHVEATGTAVNETPLFESAIVENNGFEVVDMLPPSAFVAEETDDVEREDNIEKIETTASEEKQQRVVVKDSMDNAENAPVKVDEWPAVAPLFANEQSLHEEAMETDSVIVESEASSCESQATVEDVDDEEDDQFVLL